MARDYITLSCSPCEEPCAQVGSDGYHDRARKELRVYKRQLQRMFPNPPLGASFAIKSFPHDFGSYSEVVISYDDEDDASVEFASNVERNLPANWDAIAEWQLLPTFQEAMQSLQADLAAGPESRYPK